MLSAFKDELKKLAVDPKDPFHHTLRKRIGKRATELLEKRLKQLILITPGLLKRIHVQWDSSPEGSEIKKLGSFVLTYLYHPKDFLPEEKHGLFGYLDDAYLVLLVYERVMDQAKESGKIAGEQDAEYLKQIQMSKKYVKAVIPKETKKIEDMVEKAVKKGEFSDFAHALNSAA